MITLPIWLFVLICIFAAPLALVLTFALICGVVLGLSSVFLPIYTELPIDMSTVNTTTKKASKKKEDNVKVDTKNESTK